jgi:hypothetical protein
VYEASTNYVAHPLVIVALDHCTKEAVSQVQLKSVPSIDLAMKAYRSVARTSLTMEARRSVASTSLTIKAGRSVANTLLTMEAGTGRLYDRWFIG